MPNFANTNVGASKILETTALANSCKVITTWFGFRRISRAGGRVLDTVDLSLPKYSYQSQVLLRWQFHLSGTITVSSNSFPKQKYVLTLHMQTGSMDSGSTNCQRSCWNEKFLIPCGLTCCFTCSSKCCAFVSLWFAAWRHYLGYSLGICEINAKLIKIFSSDDSGS